jgi:hypothetical protein
MLDRFDKPGGRLDRTGKCVGRVDAGWRFVAPADGMRVWNKQIQLEMRWNGAYWNAGSLVGSELVIGGRKVVGIRQPGVPSPSGGTVIDVEARRAIEDLTAALISHGLME